MGSAACFPTLFWLCAVGLLTLLCHNISLCVQYGAQRRGTSASAQGQLLASRDFPLGLYALAPSRNLGCLRLHFLGPLVQGGFVWQRSCSDYT